VLIRCQLEVAFVDLRDLSQARLEVLLGFVLYAAVLDEGSVVVLAIFAGDPTKFVDIACEVERASGLKLISKPSLDFRLEVLKPHPVNGVLQPGILTTVRVSGNTALQTVRVEDVLNTVPIVPLDQHNLLRYVFTLFDCAETEDICCSRIRLLAPMCYTHPTPSGDIKPGEFSFLIHDCDEANIIGEDVDIV